LHEGSWNVLSVEANFDPAWSDLCKSFLDRRGEIKSTASAIQAVGKVSQEHRAWRSLAYFATKMHAEGEKSAWAFSAVTKVPLNQVCSLGGVRSAYATTSSPASSCCSVLWPAASCVPSWAMAHRLLAEESSTEGSDWIPDERCSEEYSVETYKD
jgi:hypothetical protein